MVNSFAFAPPFFEENVHRAYAVMVHAFASATALS